MCDGAQVFNQLFFRHPYAEILNDQLVCRIVGRYVDFKIQAVVKDFFFGQLQPANFSNASDALEINSLTKISLSL